MRPAARPPWWRTGRVAGRAPPTRSPAGSAAQLGGVEQLYRPADQADEPALLERPQRDVHALAGAADHVGQLGLGDAARPQPAVLAGGVARGLGQLEQPAGQASRQIEEDQLGGLLVGAADEPAERLEHLVDDLWVRLEQPAPLVP